MSTLIRPEVSKKNPYYISKHRYYELKHFCLQYPEWRKKCLYLQNSLRSASLREDEVKQGVAFTDPVSEAVIKIQKYRSFIELVESSVQDTETDISWYLIKTVTEGYSYTYLKTVADIPCSKDYFYKTCRKFWWILDKKRDSRNLHAL